MQLLDRYLQAVRKHLPRNRPDDIIEELRANILSQVEDREEQLGRPLHLEEEEALLRQHGHPMLVAARYLPQQHLIGPAVFPYYWYALKTAAPWVVAIYFLANALRFLNEPFTSGAVVKIFLGFFGVAASVAFWITVVFAAMEWATARYLRDPQALWSWNPRALPEIEPEPEKCAPKQPMVDIVLQSIAIVYVLAIPKYPFLLLGPGAAFLRYVRPSGMWHLVYWVIVGLLIAKVIVQCWFVADPRARKSAYPLLQIAGKAASAAVVGLILFLIPNRNFFLLRDTARDIAQYGNLVATMNDAMYVGLRMALVVAIVHLLWTAATVLFRKQPHAAAVNGH